MALLIVKEPVFLNDSPLIVFGGSGSGKTTVLKDCYDHDSYTSGDYITSMEICDVLNLWIHLCKEKHPPTKLYFDGVVDKYLKDVRPIGNHTIRELAKTLFTNMLTTCKNNNTHIAMTLCNPDELNITDAIYIYCSKSVFQKYGHLGKLTDVQYSKEGKIVLDSINRKGWIYAP